MCIYIHTHIYTHTHWNIITGARHLSSLWILHITAVKYYRSCTRIFISASSLRTIPLRTKPLQLQEEVPQARFTSSVKQVPNNQTEVASGSYQLWLWFCCSAGSPVSFTCRKKFDKKSMPISKLKWERENAEYCIKPLHNTSTVESFKHLRSLRLLNVNSGKTHFSMDMQRHLNMHPRCYRISLFVLFMV